MRIYWHQTEHGPQGETEAKDMTDAYEDLKKRLAEAAEQPGSLVAVDGNGAYVETIPPLEQDESEYGRALRKLQADLEAAGAGDVRWVERD